MPQAIFETPYRPVLRLEIARTLVDWQRGLMWRRYLEPGTGMLFVYPREAHLTVWMKNTYISLDIIFISHDLRVVDVYADAEPLSAQTIQSLAPARYVLEVNAGFARQFGVVPGACVTLSA